MYMDNKGKMIARGIMSAMTHFMSKMATINPYIGETYHFADDVKFGYYVSDPIPVLEYMEKNKRKSILDLGCGAGILLKIISIMKPDVIIGGIENDVPLYVFARGFISGCVKKGDITTLTTEDIKGYEVLYAWEPIRCKELAATFARNLYSIMTSNQTFLLRHDGIMLRELEKVFGKVSKSNNLYVFKKPANVRKRSKKIPDHVQVSSTSV